MIIQLSIPWLIAVNILAWLAIHLGAAWLGTRLPVHLFGPRQWLYRARRWEADGRIYEGPLRVKQWKGLLPDGAALFSGGFRKASLQSRSGAYYERFVRETCRGEAVHWVVLLCSLPFFLWNPPWAGCVMILYAVVANMPCIVAQRYNRLRLTRLLRRKQRRASSE